METTAKDHLRTARADARALRDAARDAARHARAAGNAEVQKLIEDVEDLIRHLGATVDPDTARLRARVADAVTDTRRALAEGATQVRRHAGEALAASDTYVHAQPWQAIGAAAVAGLVVGFLVRR